MRRSHLFALGCAFLLSLQAGPALSAEATLTRFGPVVLTPSPSLPGVEREAFFGVPGPAQLVVGLADGAPDAPPADATIDLNGQRVWQSGKAGFRDGVSVTDVLLAETNTLRVALHGYQGRALTVRVTQPASADLAVTGRIHFNINTNDYARTREFYRLLGFANAFGPFPETNTLNMSHAVGMSAPYRMFAELIYLGPADLEVTKLQIPTGRFIDIIHWLEPKNVEPAYPRLNMLGISRVVFSTTSLDADLARMQAFGAPLVGRPATHADGSRFAIIRDPAGTFVELCEEPGVKPVETNGSFVSAVHHLAINVSDFERSRAFYRLLGFTSGTPLRTQASAEEARAMGFDAPFTVRAEMIRHERDGSLIELTEWQQPRDLTPPHPAPINHPGMHRINYATEDVDGDVAALLEQGVRFLSPVARCCDGERSTMGIAVFADPDGTYLQLLGTVKAAAAN